MTKIFTYSQPLDADVLDAFCVLQKGFTDQFVYYDKHAPVRYLGLGRCIAIDAMSQAECELQGPANLAPVFFSFQRFDAANPKPADEMFQAFPQLRFMLPEVVLAHTPEGAFLQVNSLGPVYKGRVDRFSRQAESAPPRTRRSIGYTLEPTSPERWASQVQQALAAIGEGTVSKVVLSRQVRLTADSPFSSKDLVVNLADGPARGTVFLYRYGDVFFCGCTPELLARKRGSAVESMCLAGTIGAGDNESQTHSRAQTLLADAKNLREHAFVADFVRQVFSRNCHDVRMLDAPGIKQLTHVLHLYTPVQAQMMEGRSIQNLAGQLHPTPALSGSPVGESLMLIRRIEAYNRGLYGGSVGYVDANGDGEFSVAIRSGVFDGQHGWLYAGCGIVEGSQAAEEYDEIDLKLQTILTAFCGSEHAC